MTRPRPKASSAASWRIASSIAARYGDYAILYRGNHQAKLFEQQLREQSVPYEISGGQSYFERVEIKDIVAYLRLIANDDDDPAFIRAVTTPKRGVGATTLEKLGAVGGARHESLFAAVFADEARAVVPARQREILDAFCALINGLRYRAEREPVARLLDELVAAIGYEDFLDSTCDRKQAETRWRSVRDFVGWLSRKGEADRKNLLELTQMIALITMLEGQDERETDAVRLSTLHAAKGLEFPHVFLVGLEEGLLPHRESVANGNVDEERRLFYVGITRAQQSLHLSFCRRRRRAGEGGRMPALALPRASSRRRTCAGPANRFRPTRPRGEGGRQRAAEGDEGDARGQVAGTATGKRHDATPSCAGRIDELRAPVII